jgi:hypothetical protein
MGSIVVTSVLLLLGIAFFIAIWFIGIAIDASHDAHLVHMGRPPVADHRRGLALRVYDSLMRRGLDHAEESDTRNHVNEGQVAQRNTRWQRKEKGSRKRKG